MLTLLEAPAFQDLAGHPQETVGSMRNDDRGWAVVGEKIAAESLQVGRNMLCPSGTVLPHSNSAASVDSTSGVGLLVGTDGSADIPARVFPPREGCQSLFP